MDALRRGLDAEPGALAAPSQFGHAEAFWVNGVEIAHIEGEHVLEVRLTRKVISEMRPELKAHDSVRLRRHTSDWLEVVIAGGDDTEFAISLFRRAVEEHRHRR